MTSSLEGFHCVWKGSDCRNVCENVELKEENGYGMIVQCSSIVLLTPMSITKRSEQARWTRRVASCSGPFQSTHRPLSSSFCTIMILSPLKVTDIMFKHRITLRQFWEHHVEKLLRLYSNCTTWTRHLPSPEPTWRDNKLEAFETAKPKVSPTDSGIFAGMIVDPYCSCHFFFSSLPTSTIGQLCTLRSECTRVQRLMED
ncbi:uncharacterized protein EAF01_005332 [Botrytis porri]|uniref:uncharacterized protein n=1 Tax=Botrytis porri TaxID=87229 RepID=UPI0019024F77|nr:uncharacterized protein EAF01_005332 [Botrytis porri]KAF7907746.1 hypothetical protein EAF01_005332 [Botrytis porri]